MSRAQRFLVEVHNDNGTIQWVAPGDTDEFADHRADAKRFRSYSAACREAVVWYATCGISYALVTDTDGNRVLCDPELSPV